MKPMHGFNCDIGFSSDTTPIASAVATAALAADPFMSITSSLDLNIQNWS